MAIIYDSSGNEIQGPSRNFSGIQSMALPSGGGGGGGPSRSPITPQGGFGGPYGYNPNSTFSGGIPYLPNRTLIKNAWNIGNYQDPVGRTQLHNAFGLGTYVDPVGDTQIRNAFGIGNYKNPVGTTEVKNSFGIGNYQPPPGYSGGVSPQVSGLVGGGGGGAGSPTNTGAPGSTMPSPQLSSYGSDPTSQLGVGGVPGATNYPISSPSIGYNPTYGGIPGPIGIPNPFQDLSGVLPGLGGLNQSASNNVLSELSGQLSPGTMALLQDKSAQFGVGSGMPGSGLARNRNLRDLGLTSEALSTQGLADYNRLVSAVSGTQTVPPSLQAEIAARNANMNAAPLPSAAQSYAQQLFDKYLQNMRGPGGGGNSLFGPQSGTGSQGPLGLGGVNASGLGFGFGQAGQGYNPGGVPPSSSGQDFSGLSEADFENMMFGFDPSQSNAYPPQYTDPSWDPGTDWSYLTEGGGP